jgi:murein tripeptide amidase MpaA
MSKYNHLSHDELTRLLHDYAAVVPDLVSLSSLGKSWEGRDIWLVVVTNKATGADTDKPAFWADGNIHAAELTASTACLYWLHTLATGYPADPSVRQLLDTRVAYIVPRLNPDGAELALADRPRYIRASTRPYPFDEDPVDGQGPQHREQPPQRHVREQADHHEHHQRLQVAGACAQQRLGAAA